MFAVYNMGMMDQPLGELSVKVNDGNYHVVRLSRLGPNATLQLDDLPEIYKYPSGKLKMHRKDFRAIYCRKIMQLWA